MRPFGVIIGLLLLGLAACTDSATAPAKQEARILVMGDSLFAWNSNSGHGVADYLEHELGAPVLDRSVLAARMIHGLPVTGSLGLRIDAQYVARDWDWIVITGGGNDLLTSCGCTTCDAHLAKLISADGKTGVIPDMLAAFRETGAKIIYAGYLRTPGFESPIEACTKIGGQLEARLSRLARRTKNLYFLSNTSLVPDGDTSFHASDRIHPSHKGSAALAQRIAEIIKKKR